MPYITEKKDIHERKVYSCPEIIIISIDNDIALALESEPPSAPFESMNSSPENQPYYTNNSCG